MIQYREIEVDFYTLRLLKEKRNMMNMKILYVSIFIKDFLY